MNRWAYLIPRLFILGLIGVAVWMGKDPLLRYAIVRQTQHLTGAKVEIGQLRSAPEQGMLFLNDLKVTDPRDPMRNFLQADIAHLKFDTEKLWHQEFVIETGQTNRLVFGTPRTESGALVTDAGSATPQPPRSPRADDDPTLRQIGQTWLDRIELEPQAVKTHDSHNSQIETLADELRPFWPEQLKRYSHQIETLNPAIEKLKNSLVTQFQNPLRDLDRQQRATQQLHQLQQTSDTLHHELTQRMLQLEQEKKQLLEAKTKDLARLQKQTKTNQFDPDLVSQLLLYQTEQTLVDEIVDWFRWFETTLPAPQGPRTAPHSQAAHRHGIDIVFPNGRRAPKFLIKRLELEGEGRIANQHLNFVGTAFDVTNQPHRHDRPTRFELRAQGKQHMIVDCQIDRRNDSSVDTLHVQCPNLEFPSQSLGHANSLLVSLGPASRVTADIHLQLTGNQLTGTLAFQHSNVALHVDRLAELAGGDETASRINQDILAINRFTTSITLDGTLDDYSFETTTDLGEQFAATVDRVVIERFQQHTEQQRKRLDEIATAEIQHRTQVVKPALEKLAAQLNQNVARMADLKNTIESTDRSRLPKIR